MRVFVAGWNRGRRPAARRRTAGPGHEVTASTRRTEHLALIEALGARPALADGLDAAAMRQAILEARPEVIDRMDDCALGAGRDYATWLAVTNRLRREGTRH